MMRLSSLFRTALAFLLGWFIQLQIAPATEPNWPVLEFTPVVSGVESPVDIQNAGDGSKRLFIVQQGGKIRILKNGALLPVPLLDISDKIASSGEQGLLGLAFPPDFTARKCFYACYCRKSDGAIVVSRFRISGDPDIASADSEEVLLVIPKTRDNHNGGQLAFGPDGLLYISTGDGGGQGDLERNSQNLQTRLGKILRIDVSKTSPGLPYAIPPSNPFATYKTYWREILCWGLRNPWRFSFDSLTGDLYIGDVGGDTREEINHIPAASINQGTNFGWSVKEGTLDFIKQPNVVGTLKPPAYEYGHNRDGGYSVTGGLVYRGNNPRLHGFYLFADFATGRMWAMEPPGAGGRVMKLKDTEYGFTTFGRDEAGEIYFADYHDRTVYRVDAPDTLPAPEIAGGTDSEGVYFTIKTDAPGAVIRYTTDGTTPNEGSPLFTSGQWIRNADPIMVKAIAYRAGLHSSTVAEDKFEFLLPEVKIGSYQNHFNDYTTIHLTNAVPGTRIHYTLDGSEPTQSSPLYSPESGLFLDRSVQVRAIAFKAGFGWLPSVSSWRHFDLTVAPPKMPPHFTELHDPVILIPQTPGSLLHYTVDGSTPTLQSPIWKNPQYLPPSTNLKVMAVKGQMQRVLVEYKVVTISSEKTRFEKLVPGEAGYIRDVVRADDSTFYAVGHYGQIWKLTAGKWNISHTVEAGRIDSVCITPAGDLALADTEKSAIIQLQPPFKTVSDRWAASPAGIRNFLPLPGGGFLFTDSTGRHIHKIRDSSNVSVHAGSGNIGGMDGPSTQATFNGLNGIADDGNGGIFVTEDSGRRVRRIGNDGIVTTIAGNGESAWTDGIHTDARFVNPGAIVRDRIGNLYVAEDAAAGKIRKIKPDGMVTTLLDSSFNSYSFGPSNPTGLDVDDKGVLYVVGKISGQTTVIKATQEDWDNDGIPDETEAALGAPFVVGVDDRLADSDGDLFSNCAEWISGTDALFASSQPGGRRQIELRDGTVSLNLPCEPGKTQQLEYSEDMKTWRPMGVPVKTSLKSVTARLPASPLVTQRFYRLTSTP